MYVPEASATPGRATGRLNVSNILWFSLTPAWIDIAVVTVTSVAARSALNDLRESMSHLFQHPTCLIARCTLEITPRVGQSNGPRRIVGNDSPRRYRGMRSPQGV